MSTPSAFASKLWNCRRILRDDNLSCGDYVEQLTFLLILDATITGDLEHKQSARGRKITPP